MKNKVRGIKNLLNDKDIRIRVVIPDGTWGEENKYMSIIVGNVVSNEKAIVLLPHKSNVEDIKKESNINAQIEMLNEILQNDTIDKRTIEMYLESINPSVEDV